MEPESEYRKVVREEKERKELLSAVMKEIELFQLNQEGKDDDSGDEDSSFELPEKEFSGRPPGVRCFSGDSNCLYNQNSMLGDLEILWCNYEDYDLAALQEIEEKILYEYAEVNNQTRFKLFEFFYKILFTDQLHLYLSTATSIILELLSKTHNMTTLLHKALEILPTGIKNLGGQVNKIYSAEKSAELPEIEEAVMIKDKEFSPVENIRSILNILQYMISKENVASKSKLKIPVASLDNISFLLLVISQDPSILRSNVVPTIQNFLAVVLDLYPSDSNFLEKVQDIVERLIMYWDGCTEGFNHHTAFYVACDVIPISIRGKQLRACFSLCALMCCLTPDEVEAMDIVPLSTLSKFCVEHTEELVDLDFNACYSVVRLIDAAIDRPFYYERDGKYLKEILDTVNKAFQRMESKYGISDWYYKPRLAALLREISSEWNRLLVPPDESVGHKRKMQ